ncbi:MAG TPA: N-6 DNA methylase [Bacteroidales bacterium]|nr:N-6 DNA methylase [Bacteroidales bacterium]
MDLSFFNRANILESTQQFFKTVLDINIAPAAQSEINLQEFLKEQLTDAQLLARVKDARFAGMVNSLTMEGKMASESTKLPGTEPFGDYDMLLVFGIELHENNKPAKTDISRLTRALNRRSFSRPVVLILKYGTHISFSSAERGQYKRAGQQGEKIGRISMLRHIDTQRVHAGHQRILLQLRINPLKVSTFKELYAQWLEVFNVNILNKEFYSELFTLYLWAVRTVSFPTRVDDNTDDTVYNSENVIRLLTRLIFIWFVKEKGIVPDALFDQKEISDTLKAFNPNAGDNSDYYKAILQNLFFATLNTEMPKDFGSRAFIDEKKKSASTGYTEEYMDHLVFRHKNLFSDPGQGLKLFENIPFLNGGLFECLDRRDPETNDEVRIDGFSSKPSKQPVVPNILFFGKNDDLDLSDEFENGNKYKHCNVRGIINILNSYKFTIEENTPLEQEIALDPELLGKIFENLLASYNPETRTTARKQTGSYYTPREIVNYMVDESLIAYLTSKVSDGSLDDKLRRLFAYESEENPFAGDKETTRAIISALSECKILDPACGSGAFPMGVLHKMVFALGKLDPQNFSWKQAQLEKAQRDKQRALQFEDETLRLTALKSAEEKIAYVEASFGEAGHELDYARKLFLIENCIYGVDIQQIAVQISKLRFFISLMVDQRVDDSKPNRNILSLPNLETKFVAANTLIAVDKPKQLMLKDPEVERAEKELHEIHQKVFFTRHYSDKKKLKSREMQTRHSLRRLYVERAGYSQDAAGKITQWNPFDPLKAAPFFDAGVMFTLDNDTHGGYFDVVIGNPPYIQLQKDGGKLAGKYEKQNFATFERTGDIYSLFYEKGMQILTRKGHLTYITSNKWMRAGYGKSTRAFLAKHNPVKLLDLGSGIFESATVDTNILVIQKAPNQQNCQAADLSKSKNIQQLDSLNYQTIANLGANSWIIAGTVEQSIKEKIERAGKPLKDWDINIYRGILTGYNEAFIIDGKTKDSLIAQDPKSAEIIKPILRGRDIKRYKAEFADLWLINTHNGVKGKFPRIDVEKDYPAIYEHLKHYESQLAKRQDQGDHWTNLRNCAYVQEFEKEKIVYIEIQTDNKAEGFDFPCFQYDNKNMVVLNTGYILSGESIKYILAVLNSSLGRVLVKNYVVRLSERQFRMLAMSVNQFPIPPLSKQEQKPFIELVDKILAGKENDQNTSALEEEIDLMVYRLYDLSYDEVRVIDPGFGLSKEEYEVVMLE